VKCLAACILAFGVALAGCGPNPQPSGSPAESASPVVTASPEGSLEAFDPGWRQVDLAAPADMNLSGAYAGPSGLVIVGGRFGPLGFVGTTWTSRDGTTWQAQATPGLMAPALGAAIGNVEVLVGTGETNRCAHPFGETTWARRDGGDWAAAPFQQQLFCAGGNPELAAGDSSFVVAGSGTGDQPFAWWSIDGLLWHDIPIPIEPSVFVRGLTWDTGTFWIIGRDDGGIVVRTSTDGQRWTGWSRLIGIPGIDPMAVVPLHGTPLLFTQEGGPDEAWQLTAPDTAVALHPAGLGELEGNLNWATATDGGRIYASLGAPGGTRLQTSTDAATWSDVAVPPLPGISITGIADDGSHLLVVGVVEVNATTWSAWIGRSPDAR
jgi:hypothetical protein